MSIQVLHCNGVWLDIGCLTAHFCSQIAHAHSFRNAQLLKNRACKFHCLINTIICAQIADNMQNNILGIYALGQLTHQVNLNNLRHHKPQFARNQNRGQIRCAHASAKSTKGTVGSGMRICYNYNFTGMNQPMVGKHLMAHTCINIHKLFNALLKAELAEILMVFGLLDSSAGCIMVKKHHNLVRVPNLLAAHFPKRLYSLPVQIVNTSYIHITVYYLTRCYFFLAGFISQKLFNSMHRPFLLLIYISYSFIMARFN